MIQFIDSSVFVVKNYSVNKKYKILLPVNDSKGSDMAIETAINFAKSYKLNVEIVSVPEENKTIDEVEKIVQKTKEKFSKNNEQDRCLFGATSLRKKNHNLKKKCPRTGKVEELPEIICSV